MAQWLHVISSYVAVTACMVKFHHYVAVVVRYTRGARCYSNVAGDHM